MEAIANFINQNYPVHMFFTVQILLAEFMFFVKQKKRSYFWVRVTIGTLLYLLIAWFHPTFGNVFIRVFFIFLWSIALMWFCLACEFKKTFFLSLVAYAIQNLSYNFGDLLTRLFGLVAAENALMYYLVSGLTFLAIYIASYFLVVKNYSKSRHFHLKSLSCYLLAVITMVVVFTKNLFSKYGIMDDKEIIALFTGFSCLLVLAVQFMSVKQSNIEEENKMIEQLLIQEKGRQKKMKETMDIINMKCHDLRYFINERGKTNNLDESFIKEVEENIDFYDKAPETGNASLNVVLSEKLLCGANNIDISYIIDSAVVDDMESSDVYALFENALDNAIEASKLEEESKRMISLNMQKQNDMGKIVIYNHCSKEVKIGTDGMPKSKKDNNFHGFGTKSIRYIVEKYGGSVIFDNKDNIFTISILLPLKQEN